MQAGRGGRAGEPRARGGCGKGEGLGGEVGGRRAAGVVASQRPAEAAAACCERAMRCLALPRAHNHPAAPLPSRPHQTHVHLPHPAPRARRPRSAAPRPARRRCRSAQEDNGGGGAFHGVEKRLRPSGALLRLHEGPDTPTRAGVRGLHSRPNCAMYTVTHKPTSLQQ